MHFGIGQFGSLDVEGGEQKLAQEQYHSPYRGHSSIGPLPSTLDHKPILKVLSCGARTSRLFTR